MARRLSMSPRSMSSAHLDHQPPTELKVVLLGDAGVGKSALVSTFVTGSYPEQPPLTASSTRGAGVAVQRPACLVAC